ncbi:ribose transport system ATP-binding protein [Rhizobiales bacterium GAS191]|nr:monosaccharide ABC transporter ATP-binding protein, CUT2 family [Rhizobiales bacterium GAS113]SEB89110.1 monosaccharide ABC transporter ATP-binding protein, CUT2 family [Rhizobiales bacterium GAS188]SED35229.1 ribose transport system ATP-binding protein [Rhizobiales bacterium GAS191]
MAEPKLAMRDIAKAFHGIAALEGVSFDCRAGEVHAICGENGAGKSTLMKILGGIYRPDSGTILLGGKETGFRHPVLARRAGISIIHQELSLLPYRSVAENIFLGEERARFGFLDRRAMRADAAEILARLGSRIDPAAQAGQLSISDQQIVEIAKALAVDAQILVLDEPTAALDDVEATRLLDLVRRLRAEGVALIYISHRMKEVFDIADRITVLKDGSKVVTVERSAVTVAQVVRMMVGRELSDFFPPRPSAPPGEAVLTVSGAGNAVVSDIDLVLRRGEIVGVAGLEGSGKSALARGIFGDEPFTRGTLRFADRDGAFATPRQAVAVGLGYLSDDRKREGLVLNQSLRDNAALVLRGFEPALAPPGSGACLAERVDGELRGVDVRAASFEQLTLELSGGNQQKAIIARWLCRDPRVLIAVEPTRGIDVAAKTAIYRILRDFTARGGAVLMVSSDLPEIVGLSDRILVMAAGRIVAELPSGVGEEEVVAHAVGHAAPAERAGPQAGVP